MVSGTIEMVIRMSDNTKMTRNLAKVSSLGVMALDIPANLLTIIVMAMVR